MGVPELHRVPASPSSIRAGRSVVLDGEAVAAQPVRLSGAEPDEPMVTEPVSRMSREEEPTMIWWAPLAVLHDPFQYWKLRASRVTVTRWVCPGLRLTLAKPRRFLGGSPVAEGWPT